MDKLLVIDDETDVRYAFKRLFDMPDLEMRMASSGEEGLSLLKEFQPNVVIMDIRMNGMSGLQTLEAIRQFDTRTPVILMTAYGATQTAIEAMKLGPTITSSNHSISPNCKNSFSKHSRRPGT